MAECCVILSSDHVKFFVTSEMGQHLYHLKFSSTRVLYLCVCINTHWSHRPVCGWVHSRRHSERVLQSAGVS